LNGKLRFEKNLHILSMMWTLSLQLVGMKLFGRPLI